MDTQDTKIIGERTVYIPELEASVIVRTLSANERERYEYTQAAIDWAKEQGIKIKRVHNHGRYPRQWGRTVRIPVFPSMPTIPYYNETILYEPIKTVDMHLHEMANEFTLLKIYICVDEYDTLHYAIPDG